MAAALLPDSTSEVGSDVGPDTSFSRQSNGPRLKLVYIQCYFVTIATILGTGILGLPVTLSHSGLYPFLISFILGVFIQALLIYFFTDVLQRAHAIQVECAKDQGPENVPLNEIDVEEELEDIEDEHEHNGPVMAGHIIIPREMNVKSPNLHLIGELFLPCGMRQLFDVVLVIQFIALLISYALAGSEAYAEVIGVNHFYVIPVFVWLLTFAVVFALEIIQPIVSILTFAKGSLLLGTIVVTFFVGLSIHHQVTEDFTYVGAPFLMGTVALGGVVNVMPFLYSKIQPVPIQVARFRQSVIFGLVTCAVLNILWCWAVLDIVPQTNSCFIYQVKHNNSLHTVTGAKTLQHEGVCAQNLSLESAEQNGEISTLPLTQIIHHLYPDYDWVALLVELFIMISITVSYLTIGAAMHHTLSGWTESMWNKDRISTYVSQLKTSNSCACCTSECICRSVISLLLFGIVFAVAMLNPQGFESMLEKVSSLFINLEAGVFIFFIVNKATNPEHMRLKIPLPLSACVYHLQYLIPVYFCFAVGYDIFTSGYAILYNGAPLPWENPEGSHGVLIPIEDHPIYSNFSHLIHNMTAEAASVAIATLSAATNNLTVSDSLSSSNGFMSDENT